MQEKLENVTIGWKTFSSTTEINPYLFYLTIVEGIFMTHQPFTRQSPLENLSLHHFCLKKLLLFSPSCCTSSQWLLRGRKFSIQIILKIFTMKTRLKVLKQSQRLSIRLSKNCPIICPKSMSNKSSKTPKINIPC